MKRIKLAYITPQYSPEFGGPWHNLMLELSRYVDVYCISQPQIYSKEKGVEEIRVNSHFTVIRFKSKAFRLRRELMIPVDIDKILDKIAPDVVQSDEFFRFTTYRAVEWARANKKPFILCSRMKARSGVIRNLAIWAFSKLPKSKLSVDYASRIVSTQGECSKEEFLKWFPHSESKITIIPSGIDIKKFANFLKDPSILNNANISNKKIILSVSRIDTMKRLPLLIESLSIIKKSVPNAILLHVGALVDKDEFKKIQDQIEKCGLKEDVIFLGLVKNNKLGNIYRVADVFANTSVGEGICFSFLESMTFGVPIVAFNQGGNYCSVKDGLNGFLVMNDDLDDFSRKIIRVLTEKDLRKCLSRGALKRVASEFNIKKNAKKYFDIYKSVLKK